MLPQSAKQAARDHPETSLCDRFAAFARLINGLILVADRPISVALADMLGLIFGEPSSRLLHAFRIDPANRRQHEIDLTLWDVGPIQTG